MIHTAKYTHGSLPLLVTVERDEDECTVTRVTAPDSEYDLSEDLFTPTQLHLLAESIDAKLSREARDTGFHARIESRVMDREMARLPEFTRAAA